ncbi:MAG: FixH family protein [Pseudomonadota bacterium]
MTTNAVAIDPPPSVTPWYRQFWPWFIMSIPAATVVACMYTIGLALSTSDSLVLKPVNGIDVLTEQHLLAEKRAVALGMTASLSLQRDTGAITVTVDALPDADRLQAMELRFSHPTVAARDLRILLSPTTSADTAAVFTGQVDQALVERWYVVLEQSDAWRLSGTWTGSSDAVLTPRGAE